LQKLAEVLAETLAKVSRISGLAISGLTKVKKMVD
jgi:hypothetical protein